MLKDSQKKPLRDRGKHSRPKKGKKKLRGQGK